MTIPGENEFKMVLNRIPAGFSMIIPGKNEFKMVLDGESVGFSMTFPGENDQIIVGTLKIPSKLTMPRFSRYFPSSHELKIPTKSGITRFSSQIGIETKKGAQNRPLVPHKRDRRTVTWFLEPSPGFLDEEFKYEDYETADDGNGEEAQSAQRGHYTEDKCDSSGNGAVGCFHYRRKSHYRESHIRNIVKKAPYEAVFDLATYKYERDHAYEICGKDHDDYIDPG